MKLLLDLQGCQSTGSRHRGVGRYSLALATTLVRLAPEHEFWVLLNGAFADTLAPLRQAFEGLVPPGRIVVFQAPAASAEFANTTSWRTRAAEQLRLQVIDAINPDLVHISSLFEGLVDDSVTSIQAGRSAIPVAVTLYDLIPLIYQERYLAYEKTRAWYLRKLESLASADLLLGISASACEEGRNHLRPGNRSIVNISTAANSIFSLPIAGGAGGESATDPPEVLVRQGISRPFVMYTGGIDWRKNIEGLIRAFALLPGPLRASHQLALVCAANPQEQAQLRAIAQTAGLAPDDVVLTGFVPDSDLVALYQTCALFVFPSLHEGFGLPVLEAMLCGAPVIGANTSSVPEVIGRADALFNPRSDTAIADLMFKALSDEDFRRSLKDHAATQSAGFTWDITARRALDAMEKLIGQRKVGPSPAPAPKARPRLAMVSPMPPAQSGIADYSADLLVVLTQHYEIEVIVDQPSVGLAPELAALPVRDVAWFRQHAHGYDRIVYQFGNSEFHKHMFALLREFPGVVVLHDFFLSGVLAWMELTGNDDQALQQALLASHGADARQFHHQQGLGATIATYPASRRVTEQATGVIVHSDYALRAADQWYGPGQSAHWTLIRQLREAPPRPDHVRARQALGLPEADFLVCSFGHLGATKLNLRLLRAWSRSTLANDPCCRLVFVGQNPPDAYGAQIEAAIRALSAPQQIAITGYTSRDLFQTYLNAADLAVQLRTQSRGETSRTVLDCLAHGIATVVNANGSMAEYPDDVLHRLDDAFTDDELVAALNALRANAAERQRLASSGVQWVRDQHDPAHIARQYCGAIEAFAARPHGSAYRRLIKAIAALPGPMSDEDQVAVATAIAATLAALNGLTAA